jgi:hypothetical protein
MNYTVPLKTFLIEERMKTIVSMGWDCVSELRPPTGLLFIPHVIWTWQQWRNDTDRGKSWFAHQSSVAVLPAELSSSKSGQICPRKRRIYPSKYLFFIIRSDFHRVRTSIDVFDTLFLGFCIVLGAEQDFFRRVISPSQRPLPTQDNTT